MKIPSKKEFQQIKFNHSSDILSEDFMILYKICAAKPLSFLVITFQKELFRKNIQIIMAIDHKIRDKKLQCNINREAVKVSTF